MRTEKIVLLLFLTCPPPRPVLWLLHEAPTSVCVRWRGELVTDTKPHGATGHVPTHQPCSEPFILSCSEGYLVCV